MATSVKPIVIRDEDTGNSYTLRFTRESIRFAEMRGFRIDDIEKAPMTKIPEFFFYAFRADNRFLSREQTDKILFEGLGGVPDGMLERLAELWSAPFEALVQNEESAKNAKMTMEL